MIKPMALWTFFCFGQFISAVSFWVLWATTKGSVK